MMVVLEWRRRSGTIDSPRAVGDAIENVIVENFQSILGNVIKEYSVAGNHA